MTSLRNACVYPREDEFLIKYKVYEGSSYHLEVTVLDRLFSGCIPKKWF